MLRIITATLEVRAKIASACTVDDIEQIGGDTVALLGLVKKLSGPQALEFLEKWAGADRPASTEFPERKGGVKIWNQERLWNQKNRLNILAT